MQELPTISRKFARRLDYTMPERLQKELQTVRHMIEIYCHDHHQTNILCQECTELFNYAEYRLENCRFQQNKPTCGNCPIHCYKKDRKQQIKEVMRYAGPKMILKHPLEAIRHLLDGRIKDPQPIR